MNNFTMTKKIPENFSVSALELMKSGIFGRFRENEMIDVEYEMFNMKINITGKALNSKLDYIFLLYLIKQNKKNITLDINKVLYDLKICNKISRPNASRKKRIIDSLRRLSSTSIYFKHLSDDMSCSFSFVNQFEQKNSELKIELNDNISSLYKQTKFKKYVNLEDFIGSRNYDVNLINYILSLNTKHCVVNLDTLKKVFVSEDKSDIEYRKELKKSLQNLVDKGIVGEFEINKKENCALIHKKKGGIKSDKLFEIMEDKRIKKAIDLRNNNIKEENKNKEKELNERKRDLDLNHYDYSYDPMNPL